MTEPRLLVRALISSALHLAAYRDADAGQVRWFAEFRSDDRQTPPSSRRLKVEIWSVGVAGAPPVWFRSDVRPELPGAQLTTYRTKGLLRERKNLEPSAGTETPGKPPSPAMSRPRGGAFVVVRARESRAHGEGRQ